jgi:opacity protein-like surface antigen
MKKFFIPLLLTTAVLLPAAPCAAEPVGVYVAPRFTAGTVKFKYFDSNRSVQTSGGALAVGYDFHPTLKVPLRVELEYNNLGDVKKTDTDRGSWGEEKDKITLGASTLFVNTYFDWHNSSAFIPYVSLGLGTSSLSVKGKGVYRDNYSGSTYTYTSSEKTTTNTAWNIGIGSAWRLSETISLDLGYRYANLGNKGRSKADEDDDYYKIKNIETHQFILGAKFLF